MAHLMEDPAFWVAVAFVIFAAFMLWKVSDKITGALDDRSVGIKKELDDAAALREEAQALLASYQRKQRDALAEADDIVAQAKVEAERLAAEAEVALEAEIKRRTDMALEKITQAEAQVVQEVRNTAIDVAIKAAGSLIKDNIDEAKAANLINQSIGDIEGKLH
ncbi:MAG: F0F1 ATP synthase subunit B [Alphaproteobacteria bacterium]|jgi:F-type H+-transporting ATPase subunit b|nr:F0F1 ATP synthase subunit B [Alphaproteobacteria bacterium]MBT4017644.1 F0F1 ATP synthase subunit B [Alphaproteobacteria bacterium]MBT4964776.1 F0F1 ATP synthase subunit B [Alphaproteobacteria bacterium]MBT5162102.1 F0F1 ATP synthase subunit B [Alphaproteobacteria bacterium]MBT6384637.1 F0F1 ATP synthase subunit B [Alphaproteobacteria bacterium]